MRYTSAAVSSALDTSRTSGPMTYWIAADISGIVRAAEHEGVDVRLDAAGPGTPRATPNSSGPLVTPASTNSTKRGQAVLNSSSPDAAANASS